MTLPLAGDKHPSVVFVDLDSTLADTRHRRHLMPRDALNGDWVPFAMACSGDIPLLGTIALVRALSEAGRLIFLVSGRSEEARQPTVEWLARHRVPYNDLRMNKDNEGLDNVAYKLRHLVFVRSKGFQVELILDDWPRVCTAFELAGVPALCVNPRYDMGPATYTSEDPTLINSLAVFQ